MQPVLDLLAGTSNSTEAEIFKDCGADEVCIPDLMLQSTLYVLSNYYILVVDVIVVKKLWHFITMHLSI